MTGQGPRPPLPIGSCDCHSHIYLPLVEYPIRPGQHYEESAGVADYIAACNALGVSHHVIVQGKAFPGADSTLAAVDRLGAERSRAIIFPADNMTDERLAAWHGAGVRGVRFLFRAGEDIDHARIAVTANRIAHLGWHIIVQAEGEELAKHYDKFAPLPTTIVVDHIGRLPRGANAANHALAALLDFLADGGWIKIAAPYNLSVDGASDFSSLAGTIQSLVSAAPQRCIWGLNFPHPNLPAAKKPDETATVRSLLKLLDDTDIRRIFVTNPNKLYGFAAAAEG